MEDHNQSRNQTNSADEENIIELSAEMALPDQKKHKIIDLIHDIDSPVDQDETPSMEKPLREEVSDISENRHTDDRTDRSTPSVTDVEDIPATSEIEHPAEMIDEPAETIENEVDAAFDAVAVQPPEPTPPTVDDLLFDELSDITLEVDEAIGKPDRSDPTDEDQSPPTDAEPLDEDNLSAQAAELDAAMEGDDNDNVTFNPPGVADQQDLEIEDDIGEIQEDDVDDDIIDLVDVVDPAELENSEDEATEENEIIELTHIVDIAELESLDAEDQNGQAEIETAGLPDATQAQGAAVKGRNREEELTLSDIADGSDFTEGIEASPETDDIFDPVELDGLFDDDISEEILSDDAAIVPDPAVDDADGLFDIVDDFSNAQMPEEVMSDDIESIPSLEATNGLFDIEDQINGSPIPDKESSEAMDTDPIAPLEEKTEDQEQIIQLADILSASKKEQPADERAPISPEVDTNNPTDTLETQDETNGLDSIPADDTANDNALFEDKKIEAAVEKIIRTKYADKMEQLIASAVEKAVTQEIENIKRTLSDNDESPA